MIDVKLVHFGYSPFAIRFSSAEKTREAIKKFREELIWYFAEFKPRLDANT